MTVQDDSLLVPSSDDVDEAYSEIQAEIKQLEEKLTKKLNSLKSDLGYATSPPCLLTSSSNVTLQVQGSKLLA